MRHVGICLAAIIILAIIVLLTLFAAPPDLKPGDPVVVLMDKTIIQNGNPCRVNWAGFVSQTGPQDEFYWFRKVNPWTLEIAVISPRGHITWENYLYILGPSDTPKYQICTPEG